MHITMRAGCALALACALAGCFTARPAAERPERWATAVAQAQLPNLHRVDDGLWRSALPVQPDAATLHALGIRTVINLRAHDDPPWFVGSDIVTVHVPLRTWSVDAHDIEHVLRIASDPARQPVLIHCTHGADRTGTMIAAYRIVVQGWSKPDALAEMRRGGYGYHPVWINLPRVIEHLNVGAMRRALALPGATTTR